MEIKSAGTYMQLSNLCKRCSKQSFCGNGMTDYFCTGYEPQVKTASDIITPPFTDAQKMVIEATEKLGKICDVDVELDELYPTEQTNEDWLRTATTEQLAEWIHTAIFDDNFANKMADEAYMNMQTRDDYIEMWLKQPHRNE